MTVVFVAGEEVLTGYLMPMYFSSNNQMLRLVIRSMFLPGLKYCLLHLMLVAAEALDVPNKDNIYLLLIIPLTMVTVTGHSMQLGSADIQEAAIMEALLCSMEVFEVSCGMAAVRPTVRHAYVTPRRAARWTPNQPQPFPLTPSTSRTCAARPTSPRASRKSRGFGTCGRGRQVGEGRPRSPRAQGGHLSRRRRRWRRGGGRRRGACGC